MKTLNQYIKEKTIYNESILDDEEDLINNSSEIFISKFKMDNDFGDDVDVWYEDDILTLEKQSTSEWNNYIKTSFKNVKFYFPHIKEIVVNGELRIYNEDDMKYMNLPNIIRCKILKLVSYIISDVDFYCEKVVIAKDHYKSSLKNINIYGAEEINIISSTLNFLNEIGSDAKRLIIADNTFRCTLFNRSLLTKELDKILDNDYSVEYIDKKTNKVEYLKSKNFENILAKINNQTRYKLVNKKDEWFKFKDDLDPIKDMTLFKNFKNLKQIVLAGKRELQFNKYGSNWEYSFWEGTNHTMFPMKGPLYV